MKSDTPFPAVRPEILENAPMRYAPVNEMGVVFLFCHLAKKWRIKIEHIRAAFPDCIAYQKVKGEEKRIRIEFEFKSRNFKLHKHDAKKCDWIVCWEHNWPSAPKHLNIIELRREFGQGFNVWTVCASGEYQEKLDTVAKTNWSVHSQAHAGDLILFHFTRPTKAIKHVFRLVGRCEKVSADWKQGDQDYMADITRVCALNDPVYFERLQRDRVLGTAGFVRAQMQGRHNVTEHWPFIHELIVRLNPPLRKKLAKYAPEAL